MQIRRRDEGLPAIADMAMLEIGFASDGDGFDAAGDDGRFRTPSPSLRRTPDVILRDDYFGRHRA